MHVVFESEHPLTDDACRLATGKSLSEWYAELDREAFGNKRRDAINWLTERARKDAWWSTTIWVEYERTRGVVNKKDGLPEGYNLCATKTIAVPPATVYAAFVEPGQLVRWFGDDVRARVAEGGRFEDRRGNQGEYLRVRENKDLRFSWRSGAERPSTLVEVAFAAKGADKTGVTLTHARIQTREEADGLRIAWGEALARLKEQLEV